MKTDNVAGAVFAKLRQDSKRILVKRPLLQQRLFTRRKKRRIHRPPTHHQIYKQTQKRVVEESATHWKEKLFAPGRVAKEHSRYTVHIEERTVIGGQEYWAIS